VKGYDSCEAVNKGTASCEKNADDEIPHHTCGAGLGDSRCASAARVDPCISGNINLSATSSQGAGRAPVAIARPLPQQRGPDRPFARQIHCRSGTRQRVENAAMRHTVLVRTGAGRVRTMGVLGIGFKWRGMWFRRLWGNRKLAATILNKNSSAMSLCGT
jgi:hypothetical protein